MVHHEGTIIYCSFHGPSQLYLIDHESVKRSKADSQGVSSKADTRGVCLPGLGIPEIVSTKIWTIVKMRIIMIKLSCHLQLIR
jgi:hypothetical protein